MKFDDATGKVRWTYQTAVHDRPPLPATMLLDSRGNIFLPKTSFDGLRKFDSDGLLIGKYSGPGDPGDPGTGDLDCTTYSDDYVKGETYQVIAQCQAAWSARCNDQPGVDAYCSIIPGYRDGAEDKCPACN